MKELLVSLEQSGLGSWVRDAPTIWAFPTILFLHTFGMAIVAGGSAMLSVMVLGFWPSVPIRPFGRMFPWMWVAFGVNAITGTLMLVADATAKLTSLDFYIKMALVFAGLFLLIRMRRQVFENSQIDQAPFSGSTKMLAWASLACWFGAITAGRLLAYVGPTAKH
ncbi:MAG TPA: hypothetical protein VG096_26750 [Bryobacteraceae bacterium]|jgi:hypothetical protein|nr:hypothetical protein [Bryobacteraceae bacterium]